MQYYKQALKQYSDFKTRTPRKAFWMFILFNIIICIILGIVDGIAGTTIRHENGSSTGILGTLYSLAVLVPSLAIGARRLHDTDRSGWWQLIGIIPIIGWIVLIIFFVQDSKPGENKYGPNPKGMSAAPTATPTPPPASPTIQM